MKSSAKFIQKADVPGILGNIPASGTEIIKDLGEQHVETGNPIVYTSADSVFQIAAHEEVIPIKRQYEICKIAREILDGEHKVGRVIARPFVGKTSETFTTHRKPTRLRRPAAKQKFAAAACRKRFRCCCHREKSLPFMMI